MKPIDRYKEYINMLINGHIFGLICKSKAGYGKTHTTLSFLKEQQQEYEYNSGVTTAVALYKLLYNHNDKIIILDDVETIFQDDRAVNLLKSALWGYNNERVVTYSTSSKTLENYPDKFIFTGKIIILANEINAKYDESFKALISRCLKYELVYTFNEVTQQAISIVTQKKDLTSEQQTKIIDIIQTKITQYHNFNFRLLERLVAFVKYDITKADELFFNSLEIDTDTKALLDVLNTETDVNKQIIKYYELTGQSRATFFRKKQKILKGDL